VLAGKAAAAVVTVLFQEPLCRVLVIVILVLSMDQSWMSEPNLSVV